MRWIVLLAACSTSMRPPGPRTLQVTVNADGSFSPPSLKVYSGDTVEWLLYDRGDAVVASAGDDCASALPYTPGDFTGPWPVAPSGTWTLSPLDSGLAVDPGCQSCPRPKAMALNGDCLCESGAFEATMETTWASPEVTGVFVRLLWSKLQPEPGRYDFTVLDREVDQAVRHGKLYSLGIKAGDDGTPGWIFASGVTRLSLQDHADGGATGCGSKMDLGSPTDEKYQELYFAMLTEVANHLKTRADWYRALGYVKINGANLFTHENRLPKNCETGCPCNPQIFAQGGYRPSKLYAFYAAEESLLASLFPGKTMSYALIQDGFPLVNEAGEWETETGASSGTHALPKGTGQTEDILMQGAAAQGDLFAVQHNGLHPIPPSGSCPNEGKHPAVPPYTGPGPCPNHWVLAAGAFGQPTGFQTLNAAGVSNPDELLASYDNLMTNSDGMFLEIYEERFWEAEEHGQSLAARTEALHQRRLDQALFPSLPEAFPMVHRHTFTTNTAQTLHYLNPSHCRAGVLELRP